MAIIGEIVLVTLIGLGLYWVAQNVRFKNSNNTEKTTDE